MEIPLIQGYFLFSLTFIGGTIMSDAVFGQVEFFTHVSTVRGEHEFEKKVKLHTVHCEYQDRFEVVGKFKADNPHVKDIYSCFVFRDYMG